MAGLAPAMTSAGKAQSLTAASPDRLDRLLRHRDAGEIGAVRGREVFARTGFAGEEQPAVEGRGERGALVGAAGQGVGIGAAGKRIAAPTVQRQRRDASGEIAAVETDQLVAREIKEGR